MSRALVPCPRTPRWFLATGDRPEVKRKQDRREPQSEIIGEGEGETEEERESRKEEERRLSGFYGSKVFRQLREELEKPGQRTKLEEDEEELRGNAIDGGAWARGWGGGNRGRPPRKICSSSE